jgi:hypothetical protein
LFVVLLALGGYESRLCWFAALLVAGVGAFSLTQRLLGPPLRNRWRAEQFERRSRP